MSNEVISLSHGSGGKATNKLINNLFYKYFDNDILNRYIYRFVCYKANIF